MAQTKLQSTTTPPVHAHPHITLPLKLQQPIPALHVQQTKFLIILMKLAQAQTPVMSQMMFIKRY